MRNEKPLYCTWTIPFLVRTDASEAFAWSWLQCSSTTGSASAAAERHKRVLESQGVEVAGHDVSQRHPYLELRFTHRDYSAEAR